MKLTRTVLRTVDRKLDAIPVDGSESLPKVATKAFDLGAIEGLLDAFVVIGAATAVVLGVTAVKSIINNK